MRHTVRSGLDGEWGTPVRFAFGVCVAVCSVRSVVVREMTVRRYPGGDKQPFLDVSMFAF